MVFYVIHDIIYYIHMENVNSVYNIIYDNSVYNI